MERPFRCARGGTSCVTRSPSSWSCRWISRRKRRHASRNGSSLFRSPRLRAPVGTVGPRGNSRSRAATRWFIEFFRDASQGSSAESVPARGFLDGCPESVRRKFLAVLDAVAAAPPPAFRGGGYWEAMHGEMAGYYEIRIDGPQRRHYRLFCLLENPGEVAGLKGPSLIVLCGMEKAFRTTF